jgi:hypothetical protein
MVYRHRHQNQSFTAEQESLLKETAGPSINIDEFLTISEFDRCFYNHVAEEITGDSGPHTFNAFTA